LRDEYGLRVFLKDTSQDFEHRCDICYRMRLTAAAACAASQGCDTFTTTLLISPYQNHERLREIGEELAARYAVPFLYRDFRPLFRAGQNAAREMGFYRQKYCGCLFSEEERYVKK
jgi:predicted adenine nucleotide alpha hydrolase (AANH) superfamily ATPase